MYNALCAFILALCSPFLLIASIRAKYKTSNKKNSLLSRFFLYKNPILKPCKYHFHACSLGEVVSIEPFVKELSKDERVGISVSTAAGYERASSFCKNVAFLPFEPFLPFWLEKCEILVVFEAELWLNLFKYAKKQGARVILLNARISERSLPKYQRFAWYYQELFKNCDEVYAQSLIDKERLESIGAKNAAVLGNIKSANEPKLTHNFTKNFSHIITLASSHEGEERGFLAEFKLRDNEQLIIAPRHPARFESVKNLVKNFALNNSYSYECLSDGGELKAKIVVIDKLGELINIYAISDIAILCGSFKKGIGGHNPFEPAFFGCGIISGEFFHNQKVLYSAVSGIKIAKDYKEACAFSHEKFNSKITNICEFEKIISIIKG